MVTDHTSPWEPDRRWAGSMIVILCVVVLGLLAWRFRVEHRNPPSSSISAQARLWELQNSIKSLASLRLKPFLPQAQVKPNSMEFPSAWDRALAAVLEAEDGNTEPGREWISKESGNAGPAAESFRRCFSRAYLSSDVSPSFTDIQAVKQALREGFAARLLEARLLESSDPAAAERIREQAKAWVIPRLAGLAAAGLVFLLMVPGGITMILLLIFTAQRPRAFPIPAVRMPGRALTIVFLGWFLTLLFSGPLIGGLVLAAPSLRPFAIPIAYLSHALAGIGFLCKAEGVSFARFFRRLLPGAHAKSLLWGAGFLALGIVAVLVVSLITAVFVKQHEPPQRELMDLMSSIHGFLPLTALFLTVALFAPIFEESLFRGTLLPWLAHRLNGPMSERAARLSALILTSIGFGLIHLQPAAIPVLSTLGLVLGMAFLRTRNLGTSILVHGLWNGGVFLFYRMVFS